MNTDEWKWFIKGMAAGILALAAALFIISWLLMRYGRAVDIYIERILAG